MKHTDSEYPAVIIEIKFYVRKRVYGNPVDDKPDGGGWDGANRWGHHRKVVLTDSNFS